MFPACPAPPETEHNRSDRARRQASTLVEVCADRCRCGVLVLLLAGLWYIHTDSFQAYVRRRMIAEVERITGGRAEIGSFHVVPFHMQVEVRDITVHGTESPTDLPLVRADHLIAQLKVISFLRAEFGFHVLDLDHPVVHIAIAPDGTTNVPAPKVKARDVRQHSDRATVRAFH